MTGNNDLVETLKKVRALLAVLKNSLPFMREEHRQIVVGTIEAGEKLLDDALERHHIEQ